MSRVIDVLISDGFNPQSKPPTQTPERAQRLEALDEVEEWQMLMGHYCYVMATRGALLASMLQGVEGLEERRPGHA